MAQLMESFAQTQLGYLDFVELLKACPASRNGILTLDDFGVISDWEEWLLRGVETRTDAYKKCSAPVILLASVGSIRLFVNYI